MSTLIGSGPARIARRLLLLLLAWCITGSSTARAQVRERNAEEELELQSAPGQRLKPPTNLRAYLLMPPPDIPIATPKVRVIWNPSRDARVDGYKITITHNGTPVQPEAKVPATVQRWDSDPLTLQYPAPLIQVRALRGDQESAPIQTAVPLTISYPALTPRLETRQVPSLPAATVKALVQDPTTGHVWVGTDGGGLARLDPRSGVIEWFTQLDGLGGNHIYALVHGRGPQGSSTLWVATDGGLTRFDTGSPHLGMETFDYKQDISKDLLPGPREITALYEDRDGMIWIGTAADGLLHFNPVTRAGRRLTTLEGLSNDTVWAILEDEPGRRLFLGTNEGLSSQTLPLERSGQIIKPLPVVTVRAMAGLPDGRLLLVTPEKLQAWSPDSAQPHGLHPFQLREEPQPGALVITPERDLWIGTRLGLRHFKYGDRVQDFRPIPVEAPATATGLNLGTEEVTALAKGIDDSLWIGLANGRGIARLSLSSGAVQHFPGDSLPLQMRISSLLKDGQGMLWIGTERGPLQMSAERSFVSLASPAIPLQRTEPPRQEGEPPVIVPWQGGDRMPEVPVQAMTQDESGNIWLGLRQGGVVRYLVPERRFQRFFRPDYKFDGTAVNTLTARPLAVYVGTETGGVKVYGTNTRDEFLEQGLSLTRGQLPSNRVLSLFVESSVLWVGTEGGLEKARLVELFGKGLGPVTSPDPDWPPPDLPDALRLSAVNAMTLDPQQSLWVASARGLWRRTPGRQEGREVWHQFLSGSIDSPALSLAIDRERRLWVGTTRGLYRSASPSTGHDAYNEEPVKVISDIGAIRAILIDEQDVAWVGTDQGLMVIPPFKSTPVTSQPVNIPAIALGTVLLFGAAGVWYYRTFRNPLVMAIKGSAETLTQFRLPELPMAIGALRRAHQLHTTLIRLGLDTQRWRRIEDASRLWPNQSATLDAAHCEQIVTSLMDVLGAEVLPLSAVRQGSGRSPLEEYGFDPITGEFTTGSEDLSTAAANPQTPVIRELDGFDLGAPGANREQPEVSGDPVPWRPEPARPPLDFDEEEPLEIIQPAEIIPHGEQPGWPNPQALNPDAQGDLVTDYLRSRKPALEGVDLGEPLPFAVRLPELPIRLAHRELPLIVVRSPLPADYPAGPLMKVMQDLSVSQRYVLVLNLSREPQLPPLNAAASRFVPLHEPDVRSLLFSASPRTTFVRHFIRRVKVTEVSPYSSKGEVSNPMMFVGRRIELERITGNDRVNYSIIGARQIGKSSLMGAIRRHYRERTRREVHPFTLTPQEDAKAFYKRFALLLHEDRVPRDSTEFAEMMEAHYRGHHPPALFLIDEVDGLLARERTLGYPVLTAMRRLQQQEICSFIIAGYWELYRLGNDYHSPLYNMAEVIELGPLKPDEARDLIVAPMERMGLTFERKSVVQEIVDATAGHPHLIQFICNQLLERMTTTHPPVFTAADWHAVQDSDELKRYVTRNFKSNAGPLDELIVYVTVSALRFTHPQLEHALQSLGLDVPLRAREESLRKLKLVGILREIDGRFEYSLPLFRRMLLKENIAYFAAARARELREGI